MLNLILSISNALSRHDAYAFRYRGSSYFAFTGGWLRVHEGRLQVALATRLLGRPRAAWADGQLLVDTVNGPVLCQGSHRSRIVLTQKSLTHLSESLQIV